MVSLSCSVIAIELVVDKRTMQQLTEHFKFSSRHGEVRSTFSLCQVLCWFVPLDSTREGLGQKKKTLCTFDFTERSLH